MTIARKEPSLPNRIETDGQFRALAEAMRPTVRAMVDDQLCDQLDAHVGKQGSDELAAFVKVVDELADERARYRLGRTSFDELCASEKRIGETIPKKMRKDAVQTVYDVVDLELPALAKKKYKDTTPKPAEAENEKTGAETPEPTEAGPAADDEVVVRPAQSATTFASGMARKRQPGPLEMERIRREARTKRKPRPPGQNQGGDEDWLLPANAPESNRGASGLPRAAAPPAKPPAAAPKPSAAPKVASQPAKPPAPPAIAEPTEPEIGIPSAPARVVAQVTERLDAGVIPEMIDQIDSALKPVFLKETGSGKIPGKAHNLVEARMNYRLGRTGGTVREIEHHEALLRRKWGDKSDALVDAIERIVDETMGTKLDVTFTPIAKNTAAIQKQVSRGRSANGQEGAGDDVAPEKDAVPPANVGFASGDVTTALSLNGDIVLAGAAIAATAVATSSANGTNPPAGISAKAGDESFLVDDDAPEKPATGTIPPPAAPTPPETPAKLPEKMEPQHAAAKIFMDFLSPSKSLPDNSSVRNIISSFGATTSAAERKLEFKRDEIPLDGSTRGFTVRLYSDMLAPLGAAISKDSPHRVIAGPRVNHSRINAVSLKPNGHTASLTITQPSVFMALAAYFDTNIGSKVPKDEKGEWDEVWKLAQQTRMRATRPGAIKPEAVGQTGIKPADIANPAEPGVSVARSA